MFLNAFAVLGTIVALILVLGVSLAALGALFAPGLKSGTVLEIDARGGFSDAPAAASVLGGRPLSFVEILLALEKAEGDDRIAGVLLRVGEGGVSPAHAQELKEALDGLRAKGKFVYAHATGFGGPGIGQYYLATLADEIWMQRTSEMNAVGLLSTTIFYRGLFDKLQATADITQRYEYKNAANVYTETDYTPAHREATTALLQSIFDRLIADMAAGRKTDPAAMQAAIFGGPYLTEEAIAAKLVDKEGFYADAEKAAKSRAGDEDADLLPIADYFAKAGSPYAMGDGTIAVIQGEGAIVDGESESGTFTGQTMGGDTIAKAIEDATEDETVKAILFRVNSPGGSALASDVILDALKKAQAAGKPVVVSMGPVAASGGYWVSMYADRIFAMPTTITGSIGVLSGKLIINRTLEMVGLNPRLLGIGPNADMYSEYAEWTPEQRAKFEKGVDQIYAAFTGRVAEGRKLPLEQVQAVAKGRVWTGQQAFELKLVDELGGFRAALKDVTKRAGLEGKRVRLRLYPEEPSAWANLAKSLGQAAAASDLLSAVAESETARAVLRAVGAAEQVEGPAARMPEMELR